MSNIIKFPEGGMTVGRALKILETVETVQEGNTVGFSVNAEQKRAIEVIWRNGNKDEFLRTL